MSSKLWLYQNVYHCFRVLLRQQRSIQPNNPDQKCTTIDIVTRFVGLEVLGGEHEAMSGLPPYSTYRIDAKVRSIGVDLLSPVLVQFDDLVVFQTLLWFCR